jgi:general stress protein 26
MADKSRADLDEKMKAIDFAILSAKTESQAVAARPMCDNRQVGYDGDGLFFTCEEIGTVADIEGDPQLGLAYQAKSRMLGMRPFFLTIEGRTELIRDKAVSQSIGRRISAAGSRTESTLRA